MNEEKLLLITRKGVFTILLLTVVLVATTLVEPILGIGMAIFMILHELGHATVAKYYDNFKCFFIENNIGVRRKRNSKTFQEDCCIRISGLLFSLLILPIASYMGADISTLVTLFLACIAGASVDLIQIIKAFKEWRT